MPGSLAGGVCRNSTRSSQSCAVAVDTSWSFAPGVIVALTGYGVVYGLRWRRPAPRAARARPAAGARRPGAAGSCACSSR